MESAALKNKLTCTAVDFSLFGYIELIKGD